MVFNHDDPWGDNYSLWNEKIDLRIFNYGVICFLKQNDHDIV